MQLDEDLFIQVLPLLRRTFSTFTQPERRKMGEKVKHGSSKKNVTLQTTNNFDNERAAKGIPIVMQLLGYRQ